MVNFPEKGLSKYEILDRWVAAEKKSDFDRWEKNLFETGPHLTSSPAIPWGDDVRHFVVEGYKRFIHNEDWCGEGEIDTAEIYRVRKSMPALEDRFLSV